MASTTATPSYTTGSNGVSWGSAVDYAQHNSAYYGALASYETAPSAAAMGQRQGCCRSEETALLSGHDANPLENMVSRPLWP